MWERSTLTDSKIVCCVTTSMNLSRNYRSLYRLAKLGSKQAGSKFSSSTTILKTTAILSCLGRTMSCQGFSCQDLSKKLTPQQFRVTQEKGTERAFTGQYYDHHEKGTYTCICCENPLFSSVTKYDSGSGWPSFYQALEASKSVESVERISDGSHGMVRVEVVCRNCKAHLGHVFDDGPAPTGERFCINSASLNFVGAEK